MIFCTYQVIFDKFFVFFRVFLSLFVPIVLSFFVFFCFFVLFVCFSPILCFLFSFVIFLSISRHFWLLFCRFLYLSRWFFEIFFVCFIVLWFFVRFASFSIVFGRFLCFCPFLCFLSYFGIFFKWILRPFRVILIIVLSFSVFFIISRWFFEIFFDIDTRKRFWSDSETISEPVLFRVVLPLLRSLSSLPVPRRVSRVAVVTSRCL